MPGITNPEPPVPEPIHEDRAEPALISATEAALRLGISQRAVRKRITAGTLRGVQIDGVWHVRLGPEPMAAPAPFPPAPEPRPRSGSGPPAPPVVTSAQSQITAIMDEWLAPITARVEALACENGTLAAELRHERERADRLAEDLAAALIERDALRDSTAPSPTVQTVPVSIWARLRHLLIGT